MSDRTWIRHPNLDNPPREVATSALRVYVRSGWQELSEDEVAAHLDQLDQQRRQRTESLAPARDDDVDQAAVDQAAVDQAAVEQPVGVHEAAPRPAPAPDASVEATADAGARPRPRRAGAQPDDTTTSREN